jgi:PKD repeat protein
MRRLFTLLLLLFAAFTPTTQAQPGTNCNASFGFQVYQNTVYFTPLMPDTLLASHVWIFGDGSANSTAVAPVHTYPAVSATYTVKHIFRRLTPNGAVACSDTVTRIVTIQTCLVKSNFSFVRDSLQPNKVYFTNLSTPTGSNMQFRWDFGDGSPFSYATNPTHVFPSAGLYVVCLRAIDSLTNCVDDTCKPVQVQGPNSCNIQANFVWSNDSIQSPGTYFFTNTSINLLPGDSIRWTFGDGTSSTLASPMHQYTSSGTYTVCLRIVRPTAAGTPPCVREICKQISVSLPGCNIQAFFTWRADSLQYNKIFFTNASFGANPGDSVRWTFGDGSTSFDFNPVHIYTQPGIYTVCLRIARVIAGSTTPCVREYCTTIMVTPPCNLNVNFNWAPDSLQLNRIRFTNLSVPLSNTDSIRWTFGDGSSSSDVNPVHVYTQPGVYTVCLRIKKNSNSPSQPSCVREICKVVVVQAPPCNIQAGFTWRADTSNPRRIIFTNTSTAPAGATAQWSFGDGGSASSWNAIREYAQAGTYIVCLTIKLNNTCIRTKCDTIRIVPTVPPCAQLANFSFVRINGSTNAYKFTPAYINPGFTYTWSFGDGSGSQAISPVHQYSSPGTYTVCLTVFRNANCVATSCKYITVLPQLNCDSVRVTYTYQKDPFMPNKVYFYTIANFPVLQQKWTITRVPATATSPTVTLFQNNPVYVFTDTGTYRVCLRAVTIGGCIKEFCQNISITQANTTQCLLTAYPNPTQGQVNVNVVLTQPQMIYAYVYNAQSILVKQKQQSGAVGNNIVNFNVSDLVPGLYTIKLVYGNRVCYAKFQKL